MRSGARRAVGALHVVHGYPLSGWIYDIVHAARRDSRAMGELAFKSPLQCENVELRSQAPESPERPPDRRRAW